MSWTNVCSAEFYRRYVRAHSEEFDTESVEEAERLARLRQARLSDFAET